MAVTFGVWDQTFTAGGDLRSSQFALVTMSGTGIILPVASGQIHTGVLQNNPNSGQNAVVRLEGMSKVIGRSTIAVNSLLTTDHSGAVMGITPTSGQYVLAQAAEATASGKKSMALIRGVASRAQ